MKFLADEDVYGLTIEFMRQHGYDVVKVVDVHLQGSSDVTILQYAEVHNLILITRDKGFGALVFLSELKNAGVILLRIQPDTIEEVHNELLKFLRIHSAQLLAGCFVVIEPGRHRLRRKE